MNSSGVAVDPVEAMSNLASAEFTNKIMLIDVGMSIMTLKPTRQGETTKAWVATTFHELIRVKGI